MHVMRQDKYKMLLDDALAGECQHKHKCILREIIEAARTIDPRVIAQMKCIEIHKWNMNKTRPHLVTWEEAMQCWVYDGYAKIFSDVYNEDDDLVTLYRKVVGEK